MGTPQQHPRPTVSLASRGVAALAGPLLLGWVAEWGGGDVRACAAASGAEGWFQSWWRGAVVIFHGGLLLVGLFAALVLVPIIIVSRRP